MDGALPLIRSYPSMGLRFDTETYLYLTALIQTAQKTDENRVYRAVAWQRLLLFWSTIPASSRHVTTC
jgi:hypothetical protein